MYIAIVPNRNSRPAYLLRESYRDGKHVRTRTLANLSELTPEQLRAFSGILKNEPWVHLKDAFTILQSRPHGHVQAILGTIRKLGLDTLIATKSSQEQRIILGLIVERILHGSSKLASARLWHTTTLAEELELEDVTVNDVYAAMDWVVERQQRIQAKLAKRHLSEGSALFYDLSSSYYEGSHCRLAHYGYSRDGKRGLPIIEYGVMTDSGGRPLAISVYEGGTSDSETVADQIDTLRTTFNLNRVVLVGDRGMITETQIEMIKTQPGIGWVSALRSSAIQKLARSGAVQMSLFDTQNIAEITSPNYPNERLVACYNPFLADDRKKTRTELLTATEKDLDKISRIITRRTTTPLSKAEIGLRVGACIKRHKMGKHFSIKIDDGVLTWERKQASIDAEAAVDGIYIIRTSEPTASLSTADAVRTYKRLAETERVFRGMKGVENRVRPIFHRNDERVKAHLFISMLAYYVEWHMREALTSLLFEDEERKEVNTMRDPVAPAKPSLAVRKKKATRQTTSGYPVQSFKTLLAQMGTICKNKCRMGTVEDAPLITLITQSDAWQAEVYRLLGM